MKNAIKLVAVCAAIMITGAMGIWLSGCAGHDVVTLTAYEMIAEEIGIAVAQNNADGDFPGWVEAYEEQMQSFYDEGDTHLVIQSLKIGIDYLLKTYSGDDLTSRRIASKIMRLLRMSGLEEKLEMPADDALVQLDPEYIMDVVRAFVGGVKMVSGGSVLYS